MNTHLEQNTSPAIEAPEITVESALDGLRVMVADVRKHAEVIESALLGQYPAEVVADKPMPMGVRGGILDLQDEMDQIRNILEKVRAGLTG